MLYYNLGQTLVHAVVLRTINSHKVSGIGRWDSQQIVKLTHMKKQKTDESKKQTK